MPFITVKKNLRLSSIKEIWELFDDWLKENWVQGYNNLAHPATDEEIEILEENLGVKLPGDYKESLKCHNGQIGYQFTFKNNEYLSIDKVYHYRNLWKDIKISGKLDGLTSKIYDNEPISNEWYNINWIPITHDGAGNHYCLDLDPDLNKNGKIGQIITMWHDSDSRSIISYSFKEFFADFVMDVLDGKTVYSDDHDGFVDEDEIDL
ncbi:hypothetical protein BVG19_g5253 [[Candida] boidinii]|nr:hypothetical protein BVG19_g5253 [[Candida] boidinii]OWB49338.1 hypothetical protein B5S27_g878 [[Candida] boidinii]